MGHDRYVARIGAYYQVLNIGHIPKNNGGGVVFGRMTPFKTEIVTGSEWNGYGLLIAIRGLIKYYCFSVVVGKQKSCL